MIVEAKLQELGLTVAGPLRAPPGFRVAWRQVRVIGTRAIIAGHGPLLADGSFGSKPGKVGQELTLEEGYAAARAAGLAVLGALKREIGDLDRVVAWTRVFGMVNVAPGFTQLAQVLDGFTDLMVSLYGEEVAICPRAVAGVATLAAGSPLIVEGEVELRPS